MMKNFIYIIFIFLSSCNNYRLEKLDGTNYNIEIENYDNNQKLILINSDSLNKCFFTTIISNDVWNIDVVWGLGHDKNISILILGDSTSYKCEYISSKVSVYNYSNSNIFYDKYFDEYNRKKNKLILKSGYRRKMIPIGYVPN